MIAVSGIKSEQDVKRVKIALKLSIDSGNKFLRLFKDLFLDVWANFKEVEVIVGEHAGFM